MAASSSTMVLSRWSARSGRVRQKGRLARPRRSRTLKTTPPRKPSLRKMAMETPKRVPMIRARMELYRVPQMGARMPNSLVLGSQVLPERKPAP